jgi:hypothetical protein
VDSEHENEALPSCKAVHDQIAGIRKGVWEWTKEWGPVSNWGLKFRDELCAARDRGRVESWINNMWMMAATGRSLLKKLKEVGGMEWPLKQGETQDVFRQSFDLMITLQEGVTLLEARLVATDAYLLIS